MKILSIETSCDETALAVIEGSGDLKSPSFKILGTALYSQIEIHRQFGGVFPAVAKREHAKRLVPLLTSLFQKTPLEFEKIKKENAVSPIQEKKIKDLLQREIGLAEELLEFVRKNPKPKIDMIAVTVGPGLEPALWVGINFAKALSLFWDIPVMPINHMEGHIVSVLTSAENLSAETDVRFPAVALLISGGHTEIVLVENWGKYQILGSTQDDAVGEAFDKTARLLDLPYPGGPEISKLAEKLRESETDPEIKSALEIKLPRPMINSGNYNFSFSGLKTAVLYLIKKLNEQNKLTEKIKAEIALEFENAASEVLLNKTQKAAQEYNAKTIILGGGVTANKHIRRVFSELVGPNLKVLMPQRDLSTDNAVMIGMAGFLKSFSEKPTVDPELTAAGNLRL
ncbi:MAG TPA: tRNA (adenosine(37)-N6)-threonylcarbamoyltransferase complex transferase subunit TsaD [Candidatus Paceibacterota bacterium]|nr:tRNA (adenosine(37)-N6)-threonylcarbamoyltransferase complex transferase subunit TsaD [Candidatus Paceibacterota bacterium]HRZ34616.1 tRNA (adenosine(37)-N6)-threonylcarbamoyltransferase complex transferase subunit TsaD [Candidatus Paceibacterota bacterium]